MLANKDTIMIHCAATQPKWMAESGLKRQVQEIRRWHVEDRGFSDIGYASLIGRAGDVEPGRDLNKDGSTYDDIGAGARGHNTRSIHICLIGGFGSDASDAFTDHFTPAQGKALRAEIQRVKKAVEAAGGRIKRVIGHNEVAAKACPGFNVARWLAGKPAKRPARVVNVPNVAIGVSATTGIAAVSSASGLIESLGALHPAVQGLMVLAIVAGAAIALWSVSRRTRGAA